jgi:valyl-tRNA synthetase
LKQKLEEGRENFIEKIADWVKEMLGKILNKD